MQIHNAQGIHVSPKGHVLFLMLCSSWRCRSARYSGHGSNAILRARCHSKHLSGRVYRRVVYQGVARAFNAFQIFTWGSPYPLHPVWIPAPLCYCPSPIILVLARRAIQSIGGPDIRTSYMRVVQYWLPSDVPYSRSCTTLQSPRSRTEVTLFPAT